jgi:predicted ATP-grasp superfamily ATP-dependent carboligase
MLHTLVADFLSLDGIAVDVLQDVRFQGSCLPPGCNVHAVRGLEEEQRQLARLAEIADWSVIIAPEFSGHLHARCRLVEQGGGRLLGPGSNLVALASDKQATAEFLSARGIRVPTGVALGPGEALPQDFDYPAVLKPRDGAGSQGIELVDQPLSRRVNRMSPARLEVFCPGTAASVALLCGPRQTVPLAPCYQRLSNDGQLSYQGGAVPLDDALVPRARDLAMRTVTSLRGEFAAEEFRGYMGVDLVLGADHSGADDRVIEINPRLTTSYVGLRALAEDNLAEAMLNLAQGRRVDLSWRPGTIEFDALGELRFSLVGGGL